MTSPDLNQFHLNPYHVHTGPTVAASIIQEIQNKVASLEVSEKMNKRQIENLTLQLQKASQTTRTEAFVGKVRI